MRSLSVLALILAIGAAAAADSPAPRCATELVCSSGVCKCSAPKKNAATVLKPRELVMPKPIMAQRMAALSGTPVRGVTMISPDGTVTVARRLPAGGVAVALHMKPTGEWEEAIASAPPNIVHDLAELTAYIDKVIGSVP